MFIDPLLLLLFAIVSAGAATWIGWQARRQRTTPQRGEAFFHVGRQADRLPDGRAGRETATQISSPVSSQIGAFLEVVSGDDVLLGKMIPLYQQGCTKAGRSLEQAELVFNLHRPHSVVSRLHCEFADINGIFRVRDLGSSQGTYLNGMRLLAGGEGQVLLEGDRIELGPSERGGVLLRYHSANIRLVKPRLA